MNVVSFCNKKTYVNRKNIKKFKRNTYTFIDLIFRVTCPCTKKVFQSLTKKKKAINKKSFNCKKISYTTVIYIMKKHMPNKAQLSTSN